MNSYVIRSKCAFLPKQLLYYKKNNVTYTRRCGMRYKKIGEVKSADEDVIKCLSEKFIIISENEDDEGCITYHIIKDTAPPPPPPPKKKSLLNIVKKN